MQIVIAGSSGFVGDALVAYFRTNNLSVVRLVRGHTEGTKKRLTSESFDDNAVHWDPDTGYIDIESLNNFEIEAIVNLAGENVHQRWNRKSKNRLVDSRIRSTKLLAKTISLLDRKPKVFICASGISYYHDYHKIEKNGPKKRDSRFLDESSPAGSGFLSELCQRWEDAGRFGEISETRLVNLRIGITLGSKGGMLSELLPLFKIGLGMKWGTGKQFMSWVAIDDLVRIIHFAITNDAIQGPVNAVSPNAVTNAYFTATLGNVLSRPARLIIPQPIAQLVFGKEWADSTLLADFKIAPRILLEQGFDYAYPELEPALRHLVLERVNDAR